MKKIHKVFHCSFQYMVHITAQLRKITCMVGRGRKRLVATVALQNMQQCIQRGLRVLEPQKQEQRRGDAFATKPLLGYKKTNKLHLFTTPQHKGHLAKKMKSGVYVVSNKTKYFWL